MKEHYTLLEASIDEELESIKKKYKAKAKVYHPDMPNGSDEMFTKINNAWEYIKKYHEDPSFKAKFKEYSNERQSYNTTYVSYELNKQTVGNTYTVTAKDILIKDVININSAIRTGFIIDMELKKKNLSTVPTYNILLVTKIPIKIYNRRLDNLTTHIKVKNGSVRLDLTATISIISYIYQDIVKIYVENDVNVVIKILNPEKLRFIESTILESKIAIPKEITTHSSVTLKGLGLISNMLVGDVIFINERLTSKSDNDEVDGLPNLSFLLSTPEILAGILGLALILSVIAGI